LDTSEAIASINAKLEDFKISTEQKIEENNRMVNELSGQFKEFSAETKKQIQDNSAKLQKLRSTLRGSQPSPENSRRQSTAEFVHAIASVGQPETPEPQGLAGWTSSDHGKGSGYSPRTDLYAKYGATAAII